MKPCEMPGNLHRLPSGLWVYLAVSSHPLQSAGLQGGFDTCRAHAACHQKCTCVCYLWISGLPVEASAEGCGSVTATPEWNYTGSKCTKAPSCSTQTSTRQNKLHCQQSQTTTTPSPKMSSRYLTTSLQHLRAVSGFCCGTTGEVRA